MTTLREIVLVTLILPVYPMPHFLVWRQIEIAGWPLSEVKTSRVFSVKPPFSSAAATRPRAASVSMMKSAMC